MECFSLWSTWPIPISYFVLIQTLAHKFPCDVDFDSRVVTTPPPRTTVSPEHSFALLFVTLYGNKRILDGPICLMDGTCVNIVDSALEGERGITFIRDISTQKVQITTMNLKLPRKLDGSNIDTSKWEVDHDSLDFTSYTITMIEEMFASGAVEIGPNAAADVLSIGLGAGYINSYLHKSYPRMNITVVEIDRNMLDIALKWFGLELDNMHRVIIEDGVEYVKRIARAGAKFDVIHIDACTMEENVDTNCPIDIFYTEEMVRNYAAMLKPRGVVIMNVLTLTGNDMAAAKKESDGATWEDALQLYMRNAVWTTQRCLTALHINDSHVLSRFKRFIRSEAANDNGYISEAEGKVKKAFEKAFKKCLGKYAPFSPPNIVMTCAQFQRPPGLKERYQQLKNYSTGGQP